MRWSNPAVLTSRKFDVLGRLVASAAKQSPPHSAPERGLELRGPESPEGELSPWQSPGATPTVGLFGPVQRVHLRYRP